MTKPQNGLLLALALVLGRGSLGSAAENTTVENAALTPPTVEAKDRKQYDVWVEDCLVKVFLDDKMPANAAKEIRIHTARGEYEAAQIAVRPKDDSVGGLRATCGTLKKKDSPKTLPTPRVRYVDSVPIGKNSWQTPPDQLIATAPAWIPDVLYEVDYVPAWQDRTRSIWLTLNIPGDAEPGIYTGEITVFANEEQIKVPITVQVHSAIVPAKRRLKMTNWVYLDSMQRWNGCKPFDDRFWEFIRIYAENMAAHRQNMILTPLYKFYGSAQLVGMSADGDRLKFDFANFDRWVDIFLKAGFTDIEGSHIGWIDETIYCWFVRDCKVVQENFRADTPEAERYLAQFLPALQTHLEQKGWIDSYFQHVRDEPGDAHKATYDKTRWLMRKHAPKIKTIEATHSTDIEPPTIMVPLLSHFGEKYDIYKAMQEKGREVWFYAACGPNGSYANRFLDYHLLKVRYAHWLNFKYNVPGYLHWGYNFWPQLSPFTDIHMTWSVGPLPPGDSYIVYPTPQGVLDSIRWEAVRDGIEDYELLEVLKARKPKEAEAICSSLIQGFDKYDLDVNHFRAARLKLLEALEP
jgi:hypothetical protein